jgi:hypothetical protein
MLQVTARMFMSLIMLHAPLLFGNDQSALSFLCMFQKNAHHSYVTTHETILKPKLFSPFQSQNCLTILRDSLK